MKVKHRIPSPLKLYFQLSKRYIRDVCKGYIFQFAQQNPISISFPHQLRKTQVFKNKAGLVAKRHNLKLAAAHIANIQINTGEIFSFWQVVGQASIKNGFKTGRTIINGQLSTSVGGGLCQLSGLIYFISLEAQLEIIERHAHSLDLYDETTRYTPLGSDATVAYGYKDLRIRNNFDFPIQFLFEIKEAEISIVLVSEQQIFKKKVAFKNKVREDGLIEVCTFLDDKKFNVSFYEKMT